MASDLPNPGRPSGASVWRKSIVIALVASVPPWLVNVVVLDALFGSDVQVPENSSFLSASLTLPAVLLPVIITVLDVAVVLVLSARDRFRTDRWWLAGALFVVVTLLGQAVLAALTTGLDDSIFVYFIIEALTGYWIVTFAVGALIWRRLTPTYPPTDWLKPEDPWEE